VLREYQADNVAVALASVLRVGRQGVASFTQASPLKQGQAPARRPAPGRATFATPARLLYVLPTGGGKTVVLTAVMEALAGMGKRSLFLVHRTELLQQTVEHLRRRGIQPSVIAPDVVPELAALVHVASVQTLNRRKHMVRGVARKAQPPFARMRAR
jgi:superfamily II DNA or RNA helicase